MNLIPILCKSFLLAIFLSVALPASAERSHMLDALVEALNFDATIEIMQQEGSTYGDALAEQMLPDTDKDRWRNVVARIYDREKMLDLILDHFEAELSETDLEPLLEYYQSEEGASIVALEISARQMFLDPDIEDLAAETFEQLEKADAPIVSHIQNLIADSDLVELNVMGALNSELMFYRGLNDGGAIELSEEEMLTDVWMQEDELRNSTRIWLESFLTMSYQPLDLDELDAYATLWRTPEGRDLNRALFAGFDQMYEEISYLLGLAVAQEMTSEQL